MRLALAAAFLVLGASGCSSRGAQARSDAGGVGGTTASLPDANLGTGGAQADSGGSLATGGIGGQVTGGAAGAGRGGTAGGGGSGQATGGAAGAGAGGTAGGGSAGQAAGGTAGTGRGGSGGAGGIGASGICGNGKVEPGEQCDCGADVASQPASCPAINGVFFGDGTGCSNACTQEPSCLDKNGKTQACPGACGDGSQDSGEACDDGNVNDGDGCSHDCKIEPGSTCTTTPTAVGCKSGQGQCLPLSVIYRDFEAEDASTGHPDFHFLGSHWNGSKTPTTICIPDSSGPTRGIDATARCWGIAADALANGKPQLGATTTCKCQFTDWSINSGDHIPGGYTADDSPLSDGKGSFIGVGPTALTEVNVTGASGVSTGKVALSAATSPAPPIFVGTVPVVKNADSFRQWFMDDNTVSRTFRTTLELTSIGSDVYQYSSQAHLIQGGFFPLDAVNPDAKKLCNMSPYWNRSSGSPIWSSCQGDQYLLPPFQVTSQSDCPTGDQYEDGCWAKVTGQSHDYFFTSEARATFVYDGSVGLSLQLASDGDVFAFINGQLVLDLGGFHRLIPGKVLVAGEPGKASITEGGCLDSVGNIVGTKPGAHDCYPGSSSSPSASTPDDYRIRSMDLGLVTGKRYELAIFHANRTPTESTLEITMSGFRTVRSVCTRQ